MAAILIEPVARLIEAFARLPGIGPKTAQRLTYHLLRTPETEARTLAAALIAMREQVVFCDRCFNISDAPLCLICRDPGREQHRLCVVEEPMDVLALERTAEFKGLYHVLHGAISPIDGIGPDRLRVRELFARADEAKRRGEPFDEVIIATNPTLEGEATAMYLAERLDGVVGSVTRIARGIPVGGDLEYADEVTLIFGHFRADGPSEARDDVSNLINEIALRLLKAFFALVLAAILYVVLVGPLGQSGSPELFLLAWISGAAFILLVETSPI